MHVAAEHGLIDIAELLWKHGMSVDDADKVRKYFFKYLIFHIGWFTTTPLCMSSKPGRNG